LCSCLCKYWTSWKLKRWWVKCKFSTGTILRTVSKSGLVGFCACTKPNDL
jgi:hypothetical protein